MELMFADEMTALREMMRSIHNEAYRKAQEDMLLNKTGEICPKCGSNQYYVTDSRVRGGIRKRRKCCASCNTKWNTAEVLVD